MKLPATRMCTRLSHMRIAILILSVLAGWAGFASADEKAVFPPPQSTPKFKEVEVTIARDPTVIPLEIERQLRWRTERELASRKEPNFKLGKNGLLVDIKFIHFIEPKLPIPETWRPVPGPNGSRTMLPQTPPMPMPPIGEARILITFSETNGTKLSQFDIVRPVPLRTDLDQEHGYIADTAKIISAYARRYFLDKPAR